jgi:DNA-binding NarL/FixJ family response regulator
VTRSPTRILIADDNRAYRTGVRLRLERIPGFLVIGEVSTGADAVTAARSERADVVLMDLQMRGGNGVEATRALAGSAPEHPVAVVVVTSHAADRFLFEALEAGAVGYLLKNHDTAQLVEAIRAAASGAGMVSSRLTPVVLRELSRRRRQTAADESPALIALTRSELAIVRELSRGFTTNEALAARLGVSVNTVRSQLQAALRRTGVADRTQLALWGVRHGLDQSTA